MYARARGSFTVAFGTSSSRMLIPPADGADGEGDGAAPATPAGAAMVSTTHTTSDGNRTRSRDRVRHRTGVGTGHCRRRRVDIDRRIPGRAVVADAAGECERRARRAQAHLVTRRGLARRERARAGRRGGRAGPVVDV